MLQGRLRRLGVLVAGWVMLPMLVGTARAQAAPPAYEPAPGWRAVRAGTFSPLDPFHAAFGLGSGVGWVTDRTARENLTGTSGPTLHLDFEADIFDLVTLGASGGTIFLRDDASFNQKVWEEGEVVDAESSLNLSIVALSAGLRTPDFCLAANQTTRVGWFALYGFARMGHAWIGGGRSVAQCIDCRQEDLATPGGAFVEPGLSVGLKANDSWGASLVSSYRGYLGDAAASSELRFSIMFSNW